MTPADSIAMFPAPTLAEAFARLRGDVTGREWKPGDVAMVSALNKREPYRAYFDGTTWREYGHDMFCVDSPDTIRPLVVIDTENREQVERMTEALDAAKPPKPDLDPLGAADLRRFRNDCTQAALRSLIAPPKPPEPTNRYAVVLDADGVEWLRDKGGLWCYTAPKSPDLPHSKWIRRSWDKITAVKVLSEGVTT